MLSFSRFASSVGVESAFTVLAVAKKLMAAGKDVIELEIGDSPFASPQKAIDAAIQAIRDGHTRYGPSLGIPEFRKAAAEYVNREYGLTVTAEHVVAGPGAKNFEQLFCEAFLNAGDGVLIFSPHFPTYPPNVFRRNARVVLSELKASNDFRPSLDDVRRFRFNRDDGQVGMLDAAPVAVPRALPEPALLDRVPHESVRADTRANLEV